MERVALHPCFDFAIRSALPLPELHGGVQEARPVVEVRTGALPAHLPASRDAGLGVQVAGDTVLLTIADTARYLIRGGEEIVVDRLAGSSDRNVRLFLLGSALGILCHQRGLLLLHANAIVLGGAAFAFAGPSGAGKSTLAAYFERAGYPVLCDDVCAIRFDDNSRPFAWPGLPRLKLWGDAAEAFGHDPAGLEVAIEGLEKYHVPLAAADVAPMPLHRLYLLERAAPTMAGTMTRLEGMRAMEALFAQTYRGQYLAPMGLAARHFRQCAALLAHAEIYIASRCWGYDVFADEAERLERHMRHAAIQREEIG